MIGEKYEKKYTRDWKVGFLAGISSGFSIQESIALGELLKEDEEEEERYKNKKKSVKK